MRLLVCPKGKPKHSEAGLMRAKEAQETAARNSEMNIILANSLMKTTQTLLSLL
jgi:hypothetical protein